LGAIEESVQHRTRAVADGSLAARVVATRSPAGLGAGSALLRVRERLLAVHDDAFRVSWIALGDLAVTPWVLRGDGAPLPKSSKPDFEAAVRTADGLIHVLGSGSRPNRCTIAQLDADGATVTLAEHADLYHSVREALELGSAPNIEGALAAGDRLRLFHRGPRGTPSASADLGVGVLYGAAPRVLATAFYELGELDGVGLSITDVTAAGELAVFVASAEDAKDSVADGPIRGSAVGVLDERRGSTVARWTRLEEADGSPCLHKVEGIVVDEDLRGAWLLTDPDDLARPSHLLRVELAGLG
jgi:hypothetical protein